MIAADELAPKILSGVVYHDEGRGAFPTLAAQRGK
jgi:isopenicillin-N N-acyltransferase like protein